MLIIAGYYHVPSTQRQGLIESHAELVERSRAAPGCLDVSINPDPLDPSRVNMFELWASEADLEAWRKVANAPETGIEIDLANIQKHHISRSEPPF